MAAEVLASELDLDLYRVDLAAVVNRYITETEKNFRRIPIEGASGVNWRELKRKDCRHNRLAGRIDFSHTKRQEEPCRLTCWPRPAGQHRWLHRRAHDLRSADATQAEVLSLRDKCELADDVRAMAALVHALWGALVAAGVVKGGA